MDRSYFVHSAVVQLREVIQLLVLGQRAKSSSCIAYMSSFKFDNQRILQCDIGISTVVPSFKPAHPPQIEKTVCDARWQQTEPSLMSPDKCIALDSE